MWDVHWYAKRLAVEEREHEDVQSAPGVISGGDGDKTRRSDQVSGDKSGGGYGGAEALAIVGEICEVSEAMHFARDELGIVCAHLY